MPAIRREHGVLGFVLILLAFSTVVWALADRTPPAWDPADHLRTAFDFYQPLAHGEVRGFLREFFQVSHPYAPLFHLMAAGVFLVFGPSRLAGIVPNIAALAVLLFSVNWIGGRLYPEPPKSAALFKPGTIAAVLAVCYHFPGWLIHDAFLDYLLMALVALAFALLLRADSFQVRTHAIQFGVVAGLGMLVKQTFPFFFILPAAVLVIRAVIRRDRRAIANLVLSAAIIVLVASIWYVPHAGDVIGIYRVNVLNAAVEHEAPLWNYRSLGYYWGILVDLQIQLPFTFLFIAGVVYSIRRRFQQDWMLYLWILSGMLAFTWIANKDARYTVPILPAVALLSVSWLDRVRPNMRASGAVAIVLWASVSFLNAQWPSENRAVRLRIWDVPLYFLAGDVAKFDHRPLPDDWSVPSMVQAASGRLCVAPNIWQLNPSNIALYARMHAPLVEVVWLVDTAEPNRIESCGDVLVRTRLGTSAEQAIVDYLSEHTDRFRKVATYALPQGQEAALYESVSKLRGSSISRRERVARRAG